MAPAKQDQNDIRFGWPATLADLEASPGAEGQRHELINGDIVVTPPPGDWHQDVSHLLSVALHPFCVERNMKVRAGRGVQFPDDANMVIPDVIVFHAGRPSIKGIYAPVADVILACEIVSHSSRQRDRFATPELLAANGVPFYLLIDPFPRPVHLTLFGLDGDSYTELTRVEAGTALHLPAPFDFEVDTSEFA